MGGTADSLTPRQCEKIVIMIRNKQYEKAANFLLLKCDNEEWATFGKRISDFLDSAATTPNCDDKIQHLIICLEEFINEGRIDNLGLFGM